MMPPDRSKEGVQKVIDGLNRAALVNGSRFGPEHRAIELIQAITEDYLQLREIRDRLGDELRGLKEDHFRATQLIQLIREDRSQLREINERLQEELAIARAAKPASKSGSGGGRL